MLTAKGQGRDRAEAERIGASRFLSKPFSNSEYSRRGAGTGGRVRRPGTPLFLQRLPYRRRRRIDAARLLPVFGLFLLLLPMLWSPERRWRTADGAGRGLPVSGLGRADRGRAAAGARARRCLTRLHEGRARGRRRGAGGLMVPFNILVLVCLTYVVGLFLVAFMVERRARAGDAPGCVRRLSTRCRCRSIAPPGPSMARWATRRGRGWSSSRSTSVRHWSSSAGGGCCASWCGSARCSA